MGKVSWGPLFGLYWVHLAKLSIDLKTSTSMAITPASSAICCHPFLSRNAKVHLSSLRRLPANRSKECRPLKTSCFPKVVAMDGEQPVGYLTNSTNFPGLARPHILTLQPLQTINQSIHQSIHQSINQSNQSNQSINQSNKSINQSIKSINQSINQSVSQSVNQSINQINQINYCLAIKHQSSTD